MSNGLRAEFGPLVVTLGFAAHERGRGVAYAAIGEQGESPEILRVPFALTIRPTLRGQDVAYAALSAVADELLQRDFRDVELRVEDERIAVDLAERRKVPTPLIVPYVALRCRLNRFSRANVVARQSGSVATSRAGHVRRPRSKSPLERFQRLPRAALPTDTVELARALLGTILVSESPQGCCAVRIVETEAYPIGDAASHAASGNTPRNTAMFLRRGHAYVYFIYGTSFCINVSSERAGIGAAVLIRAGEPLLGLATMRSRHSAAAERDFAAARVGSPVRSAVTRLLDGTDLCAPGPLWLAVGTPGARIGVSARIGLSKEAGRPLRFFELGSPFLSGSARLNATGGSAEA